MEMNTPSMLSIAMHAIVHALRPIPLVVSTFLLFVLGAGVTIASQASLPGDPLYFVKVSIVEPTQATLRFTTDSRAAYEAGRLSVRLEEAASLATRDRLDTRTKTRISDSITAQLNRVRLATAAMANSGDFAGALDVHLQVEADLVANATVLAAIVHDSHGTAVSAADLLKEVSDAEQSFERERVVVQQKAVIASSQDDVRSAAERSVQSTMSRIVEADAAVKRSEHSIDGHVFIQATGRLDFAKRMFSHARVELDAGNYETAMKHAAEAQRAAQEVKSILRLSATIQTK